MKKIINALFLALFVVCTGCTEPEEMPIPTLEVNYINLDGAWQLTEWQDAPLADSTFLYIVLDRKEHTFKIYENMASMYPVLLTGSFELENDYKVGDIIRGTYDHENGNWNHEYLITSLYEESMVWTATDDATDKQKFERVAEVPAHILEAVREVVE